MSMQLKVCQLYIGHTKNTNNRLKYHNSGYVKSTAKAIPWKLVAFEKVESKDKARWIERLLKISRGKRKKWINKNRVEE
jgi:predicted GIY-YIG superfamily endonuclease